jgi:hypothetical protein
MDKPTMMCECIAPAYWDYALIYAFEILLIILIYGLVLLVYKHVSLWSDLSNDIEGYTQDEYERDRELYENIRRGPEATPDDKYMLRSLSRRMTLKLAKDAKEEG